MCRRIGIFRHIFGVSMLLLFVVFGASCRDSKTHESCFYRLSRGGYSPSTNTFLLAIHADFGKLQKVIILVTYNEEKRLLKHLFPMSPGPFDFAWAPGQAAFVMTHGNRMTLFRKDISDLSYRGTAIRCPVDFSYTFCSWNPKGEWLAVNCFDLRKPSGHRLGLYKLKEEKFVISDIVIDHRPLVWKNDAALYASNGDSVVEVKLESGAPKLVRTIPIEKGVSFFYGIFDDQALVQKNKKIKLGTKTLVELDQARRYGAITTKTTIFVSASSTNLVVFDHKGREIDRTNPKSAIHLGSIGKDPNTVYGLSDSSLLRICVEDGDLNIQEVCELAIFK